MLRTRVIPSLLIDNGDLVKSKNFTNDIYIGDPMNAVRIFNEKSVDELAIFDISATPSKRELDMPLLVDIAKAARMPLCYGGGLYDAEQAADLVKAGFEKISVSSAAINNPNILDEMARRVGAQSVVLCLDVSKDQKSKDGYSIYTHRGTRKANLDLSSALNLASDASIGEVIINSIDRDGTMLGYDLDLAKKVMANTRCPVTFLGGAGNLSHIIDLIETTGTVGAAAGSMFVFKGINKAVLISYEKP
jgi:imidazole glycerol-phosphate synthase subunit HisF